MGSENGFLTFAICLAVGFLGGLPYELVTLFRDIFCRQGRNKWIGILLDVLFFLSFTAWCIYTSYVFRYPLLRFYVWIAYALGGFIYSKILRRILAFLKNVCYNKARKVVKTKKDRKKLSKLGDKIV